MISFRVLRVDICACWMDYSRFVGLCPCALRVEVAGCMVLHHNQPGVNCTTVYLSSWCQHPRLILTLSGLILLSLCLVSGTFQVVIMSFLTSGAFDMQSRKTKTWTSLVTRIFSLLSQWMQSSLKATLATILAWVHTQWLECSVPGSACDIFCWNCSKPQHVP